MSLRDKGTASIDWLTVFVVVLLMVLGWLFIYSAQYTQELDQGLFEIKSLKKYEAGKQFLWIVIAICIIVPTILILDFKVYFTTPYYIFGGVMFLFVLVLFIGQEVGGAVSWFKIGGIKIQPAEFGKFATALAVAKFIDDSNIKYNISLTNYFKVISKFFGLTSAVVKFKKMPSFFTLLGIILLPMVLIVVQGDAGSALVYTSFIIVLFVDGLPLFIPVTLFLQVTFFVLSLAITNLYLYIAIPVIAIIAFVLVRRKTAETVVGFVIGTLYFMGVVFASNFVVNDVMQSHQRTRIMVLFGLETKLEQEKKDLYELYVNTPSEQIEEKEENRKAYRKKYEELRDLRTGDAYNITNSLIAISHGDGAGQGYGKGILHVPEQHTDFIFSRIGEEWGFLGTTFIVLCFVFLFFRLIFLAERQKSHFSRIYGYAVVGILFFHFTINMAMALGLFPVVGIPLPFFSYGGSSLWGFTILIFIFLKLDMHRSQMLAR